MKMTTKSTTIYFLIFFGIWISSCNEDDCIPIRQEMSWSSNKTIEIDSQVTTFMVLDSLVDLIEYRIKDGENLLFEYRKISNICDPEIADAVSSVTFSMIIPADSINSFSYNDSEILQTYAYVSAFAAPDGLPDQSVKEGEIHGTKIDENTWQISVAVVSTLQAYGESVGDEVRTITFDEVFTLEE